MINNDLFLLQVINIIIGTIILAPILWFVGKSLVGREKAKFTDALWIMFLGQVIGSLLSIAFGSWVTGFTANIIGLIIQLIVWLGLIKHFFDTGWGKAFIIALIAIIIAAIIFAVISIIVVGLGIITGTLL